MARAVKWLIRILAGLLVLSLLGVAAYRFLPPPVTPLMLLRAAEGDPIHAPWLAARDIPPDIVEAVLTSEDQRFCQHHGFDFVQIDKALAAEEDGKRLRGASTISQQAARDLYLVPARSFVRKGLEAYFTVLIEALWPKRRIVQAYLNTIEWGPGIYGVEAASQYAFHHPAARLTRLEAALLAAILPNPRRWSAAAPTSYIRERARTILDRMGRHEADTGCVTPLGN
ncbi:MAG TPA: monofunctional biosynthetic peptidoglycan transglycosylase [Aliidongia sp.]|uniref:monofunctional biosynthetic peptidoglycan transglycosylase n=1 Tax=Aliidongia sp. TaxID=1914230 RepID=UPI002DDD2852|nr:monofunctional biosynthetic peptidoglycan transglycosylase [Aliidongia sp.]HEV2677011.1 monofunctional biosynthetic peptidoglycan transglycosylase [Aliidongia sp.]